MRRFLLPFLFLPIMLHAQTTRSGPRLGVGLATISAGQILEWNGLPKVGPLGGWAWEIPWTRQASWLIEPMYITKGSLTQNSQQRVWTSVRLGYLELPVAIKFSLDTMPGGIFLTGSLIGGYWINGRSVVKQDGNVLFDTKYVLTNTRNRQQVSAGIGMGWDMNNSAFEVRIQQSITPFSTVIRGQNLVVGLHYTYYIPKKGQKLKRTKDEEEEG
ncbi:MAG: outer membrane beta-barrel protein [Flavobacteriales bacterium]|nr:outer membrane beta-barrel protein [Flavobacteriales bacterium]